MVLMEATTMTDVLTTAFTKVQTDVTSYVQAGLPIALSIM